MDRFFIANKESRRSRVSTARGGGEGTDGGRSVDARERHRDGIDERRATPTRLRLIPPRLRTQFRGSNYRVVNNSSLSPLPAHRLVQHSTIMTTRCREVRIYRRHRRHRFSTTYIRETEFPEDDGEAPSPTKRALFRRLRRSHRVREENFMAGTFDSR